MVHASKLVSHDFRTGDGSITCPALGGIDLTVGQSHSHQLPSRLSLGDTLLANVHKSGTGYGYVQSIVMFSDGEYLLAGINPETHEREAIPQQNFLFTKVGEKVRVFMWVPLEPSRGLRSLVQVYVPDSDDGWRKVARCWIAESTYQAWYSKRDRFMPDAECDNEVIWQ